VSAYEEIFGGEKKEGGTQSILHYFFRKILSVESVQPSTYSGHIARLNQAPVASVIPSVLPEYDNFVTTFSGSVVQ
jgi:hypothetical protein